MTCSIHPQVAMRCIISDGQANDVISIIAQAWWKCCKCISWVVLYMLVLVISSSCGLCLSVREHVEKPLGVYMTHHAPTYRCCMTRVPRILAWFVTRNSMHGKEWCIVRMTGGIVMVLTRMHIVESTYICACFDSKYHTMYCKYM